MATNQYIDLPVGGGASGGGSVLPSVVVTGTNVDWSTGNVFSKTITGNTTFTFSNPLDGQTIVFAVTNTGSFTVTWTGVTWSGGVAPVQTTGAHTDVYTFIKIGSVIYGGVIQNY